MMLAAVTDKPINDILTDVDKWVSILAAVISIALVSQRFYVKWRQGREIRVLRSEVVLDSGSDWDLEYPPS